MYESPLTTPVSVSQLPPVDALKTGVPEHDDDEKMLIVPAQPLALTVQLHGLHTVVTLAPTACFVRPLGHVWSPPW